MIERLRTPLPPRRGSNAIRALLSLSPNLSYLLLSFNAQKITTGTTSASQTGPLLFSLARLSEERVYESFNQIIDDDAARMLSQLLRQSLIELYPLCMFLVFSLVVPFQCGDARYGGSPMVGDWGQLSSNLPSKFPDPQIGHQ